MHARRQIKEGWNEPQHLDLAFLEELAGNKPAIYHKSMGLSVEYRTYVQELEPSGAYRVRLALCILRKHVAMKPVQGMVRKKSSLGQFRQKLAVDCVRYCGMQSTAGVFGLCVLALTRSG
eukprot:6189147-Pleurochrysis_carterae.AAC.2